MNNNINYELLKKQVEVEANNYAVKIIGRLKISGIYADKAIALCGDCRPCILAYLYAVYLELEEKYQAILKEIKDSGEINDYMLAWKKLKEDNIKSTKWFKDSQWRMIMEELSDSTKTMKDLINELPDPSPKGPTL